jgi:hypothetical protein
LPGEVGIYARFPQIPGEGPLHECEPREKGIFALRESALVETCMVGYAAKRRKRFAERKTASVEQPMREKETVTKASDGSA